MVSLAVCLLVTSCGNPFKDFKIESFEIVQLKENGANAATAFVELGLDNPVAAFELSGISAILKIDGQEYARLTTPETEKLIISKGKQKQHFSADVHLCEGVNPFLILSVLQTINGPSLKLDIEARAAVRGGAGARLKISKDLSDKDFGAYINKYVSGMTFNKVLKDLKITKLQLQGGITDFDVVSVTAPEGTRSFESELRLRLDIKDVPLKDGLIVSDICADLNMDSETFAVISSRERQSIEAADKIYAIVISGDMKDDFNPCMLLSLLKEDKPRIFLTGSLLVDLGFKIKLPFTFPKASM